MPLSNKQKVFAAEYVKCWNASEAARRAGYSERSARSDGPRMLSNAAIKAEIDRHLAAIQMSADEVIARLTDQARGSMADFVNAGTATIDLDKAEKAGKLHLIKSCTHAAGDKGASVKVELYDAQNALIQIGKMHKLFVDKSEVETTVRFYDVDIGSDDSDDKEGDAAPSRDAGAEGVLA